MVAFNAERTASRSWLGSGKEMTHNYPSEDQLYNLTGQEMASTITDRTYVVV